MTTPPKTNTDRCGTARASLLQHAPILSELGACVLPRADVDAESAVPVPRCSLGQHPRSRDSEPRDSGVPRHLGRLDKSTPFGVTLQYDLGMTTKERVTVTLSPDVLATAREAADGNLSARVERALLMQQLMDDAQKLAAWQRETGEERAEVLEAAALDTFGGGQ